MPLTFVNLMSLFKPVAGLTLAATVLGGLSACNEPINKPKPIIVYSDDLQVLPKQPSHGVVPETQNPFIPDAPQPVGFKPVAEACRSESAAGGARKVYHLYQGRGQIEDVGRMYRRVLPNHGWKYVQEVDDPDMIRPAMVFEKGIETLYVRLGQVKNKITLILEINPKG